MSVSKQNEVLYISLFGEIDEHNAVTARRKADRLADENAGAKSVVFDLRGVSFMDSTAIGFLIGRYKKFLRYGVNTYLTNPSENADKILSMSGVYGLMPRV
jgi:stage II sporulation protein AA (anti-sigma F factor antagonist)